MYVTAQFAYTCCEFHSKPIFYIEIHINSFISLFFFFKFFQFLFCATPESAERRCSCGLYSDTRKFDAGLANLMHRELHWLDVSETVTYKLSVLE